jgi:hypothetical protein
MEARALRTGLRREVVDAEASGSRRLEQAKVNARIRRWKSMMEREARTLFFCCFT